MKKQIFFNLIVTGSLILSGLGILPAVSQAEIPQDTTSVKASTPILNVVSSQSETVISSSAPGVDCSFGEVNQERLDQLLLYGCELIFDDRVITLDSAQQPQLVVVEPHPVFELTVDSGPVFSPSPQLTASNAPDVNTAIPSSLYPQIRFLKTSISTRHSTEIALNHILSKHSYSEADNVMRC